MNKIYKVIWSKVKNCYVVTSELAKCHTKSNGVRSTRIKTARVLSALLVSAYLAGGFGVQAAWADEAGVAGSGVERSSANASAWGNSTKAKGPNTTVWGIDSEAIGSNATAFGDTSKAYGINSLAALGGITVEGATGSVAIGDEAKANLAHSIALGSGSLANRAAGATGAAFIGTNTGSAWVSTHNAIAVGNDATVTRQITGVAAGSEDTDAVNVAQLKAAIGAGGGGGTTYTAGDGISIDADQNAISVNAGEGLEVDSGELKVKSGAITADAEGFAKAADVYAEVRPSDGKYVKKQFSAGLNMAILDTQLGQTVDALKTEINERKDADAALSDRIGALDEGTYNYIDAALNVSENLFVLDDQIGDLDTMVKSSADTITALQGKTQNISAMAGGTTVAGTLTAGETTVSGLTVGSKDVTAALSEDGKIEEENAGYVTGGTVYTAIANKADKATTLAGYGITDAYTKTETDSTFATKAAVENKADKATTIAGYGIIDVYTKSETDSAFATKAAVENKADKATTIAGYGITNAYTKTETTAAINEAITVKADKATTLAGYGITDAYTKAEADAAHTTLSDRIGTIGEDGIIIEAGKNVAENLTKIDTALKGATAKVQELFDTKANADASNVGLTAENKAAWGAKLGGGTVKSGDSSLVTGGAVYSEVRPANGFYVSETNTTGENLKELDKQVYDAKSRAVYAQNGVDALSTVVAQISGQQVADISNITDTMTKISLNIEAINDMEGVVAPKQEEPSEADDFVRGYTVYDEVRPADGNYVKQNNTTAENLKALDAQVKTNAAMVALKANTADVYAKTEADDRFAQKANSLSGYGISDAYTKTEVDNAVDEKADKATSLSGYGITDAYTKTEVDNAVGEKADKATTLKGYGITDAYTKTEVDDAVKGKANKATTLAGYGIADAYTKTEADSRFLTQTSIENKADKSTTLEGYGIKDAYTKTETTNAINTAVAGKADKSTTLEGYGIKDAYTKTETENAIDTAMADKADKATTLAGYGIKDAYTKTEADRRFLTQASIENKADKATTLEGYGITDAYTKEAVDAADDALSIRIGALDANGNYIKAASNVAQNLSVLDTQLKTAVSALEGKAAADGSNVTTPATWGSKLGTGAVTDGDGQLVTGGTVYSAIESIKTATAGAYTKIDGSNLDNIATEKWGAALGIGTVAAGDRNLVTGRTVYAVTDVLEARIEEETAARANADTALSNRIGKFTEDGVIIKADNSVSDNLVLLDKALQDAGATNKEALDKKANTDASNVGKNSEGADNSEAWGSALGTGAVESGNGKLVTGNTVYNEVRPTEDGAYVKKDKTTAENLTVLDEQVVNALSTADKANVKIEGLAAQDGKVAVQGEEHADEFVKGSTVYTYLNDGEDGKGSLALGKNSTKITIGQGSSATGNQSIAIGFGNTVTGNNSGAFGDPNEVSGSGSYAFGNDNTVSGNNTFVLGSNVTADVDNAVVLGTNSTAEAEAVSVGSEGGERQIKHVADGTDDTDAATVGQLQAASQNAYNNEVYLNNRISRLDNKVNKVGAGAAALAALHPIEMDNKFGMGLGYGNYRDAHAMALGVFYRPQENLMFSVGGSMGNGENMVNAGISIALDKGFTNSKAMMARTIKAQGEALDEQRKANAEQETKIQNLEAENAAIKEQNARLEARLAAIEAKLGK